MKGIISLLILFIAFFPGISSAASSKAVKQYQKAEACVKALNTSESKKKLRQNWEKCIKKFNNIAAKNPKSEYADDALFNIGNLYTGLYNYSKNLNDLDRAIDAYNKLIKKYPKSQYADDACFEIGEVYLKQKNSMDDALNAYKKLVKLYPKSKLKPDAEKRINDISKTIASTSIKTSAANQIKEIKSWSYPEYTKIVIEADREIGFSSRRLSQPERLYLDMPNARIKDDLKKEPIQVGDGILKQIRVSQHTQKDARIVLDLGSIEDYRLYPLPEPHSLVIEVYGTKYRKENEAKEKIVKDGKDERVPLAQQMGANKVNIIVLDPGHGGKDPGAIGKNGLMEKDVVLDIAKRLKKLLVERANKKVYLTREDDTFIPLPQRPAIAAGKDADLFISIHVNSNTKRSSRGIETYTLNSSSDKWAAKTAARENMASENSISGFEKTLRDLLTQSNNEISLELAHSVQKQLVKTLKTDYSKIDDLGVKGAPFIVLMNSRVASILAEVSFISNPDEEKRLRTPEYKQKIAEGLYEGIQKYISSSTIVASR
ncbi:MAG: N-acetylmuramoyl-L-alanine amidase [Nitrospirae bacterium]|nr:N-acetylmuramoyl-L-alanine amidase [Nitrospirota bacterium]